MTGKIINTNSKINKNGDYMYKLKVETAQQRYLNRMSDSQRKVLDKIKPQYLNPVKMMLLQNPKMKFKDFLTATFFGALAGLNVMPSRFNVVPQGEASWVGVNNEKIFDSLLKLGFPVKLI